VVRAGYDAYVGKVMPRLAGLVASEPTAYGYLAESAKEWPRQSALAVQIADAGWGRVAWRNLTCGAVALHRGVAPPASSSASSPA
jgi:demethylmenaquinone methyltransferase/2-methoxy-6-polyprenyl-1,4-benzoquinol methylase